MITYTTDRWYTAWSAGMDTGPYSLDGSAAIQTIPMEPISSFSQGESFAGQSNVYHSKIILKDYTHDNFTGQLDVPITTSYEAIARDMYNVYMRDGSQYTMMIRGAPSGSSFRDFPRADGQWASSYGVVVNPLARGYEINTYSCARINNFGGAWLVKKGIFRFICTSGIKTTPGSVVGRASFLREMAYVTARIDREETPIASQLPGLEYTTPVFQRDTFSNVAMKQRSYFVPSSINEEIIRDFMIQFSESIPNFDEESMPRFDRLTQKAADSLPAVDTNLLEAIAGLKDLKKLALQLKNLPKWVNAKKASGDYLAVQYGAIPLVDDVNKVIKAFSDVGPTINNIGLIPLNATGTFETSWDYLGKPSSSVVIRRAHLYVQPASRLGSLSNKLRNVGLFPTMENLWDLVPFSFAIDWFADVGDFLSVLDSNQQLAELEIPVSVYSEKSTHTHQRYAKGLGYIDIEYSVYSRWFQRVPTAPLYNFRDNSVTANQHWLEGAALIMQRTK